MDSRSSLPFSRACSSASSRQSRRPRPNLVETLKEGTAGAGGGARRQRLRNALVVGEVALSVALLIGAGLLVRSFWRLQHVNPGFDGSGLLTLRLNLPGLSYRTGNLKWAFYERLLSDVGALPGVQAVATSSIVPLGGGNTSTEVRRVGETADSARLSGADWRNVSPGFFRTLGIPLRGRDFNEVDTRNTQPVTIISEAAVRLSLSKRRPDRQDDRPRQLRERPDDRDRRGRRRSQPLGGRRPRTDGVRLGEDLRRLESYVPGDPRNGDPSAQAGAVRGAVRAIDPKVPVYDVRTAGDLMTASLGSRRFNMYLLACFASMALLLACVGLFGVIAYLVSQRTHDIGVRLALGAAPASVLGMVLRQGLALTTAGVMIGILGGLAVTRWMRTLLYAIEPTDAVTFVSVQVLLAARVDRCVLSPGPSGDARGSADGTAIGIEQNSEF